MSNVDSTSPSRQRREHQIGVRVSQELRDRIRKATMVHAKPYTVTQSQLVVRGIELALDELERKRK